MAAEFGSVFLIEDVQQSLVVFKVYSFATIIGRCLAAVVSPDPYLVCWLAAFIAVGSLALAAGVLFWISASVWAEASQRVGRFSSSSP